MLISKALENTADYVMESYWSTFSTDDFIVNEKRLQCSTLISSLNNLSKVDIDRLNEKIKGSVEYPECQFIDKVIIIHNQPKIIIFETDVDPNNWINANKNKFDILPCIIYIEQTNINNADQADFMNLYRNIYNNYIEEFKDFSILFDIRCAE
jgi:hypothetical protein